MNEPERTTIENAIASQARMIESLTYRNYAWSRMTHPEIPVSGWEKVYGPGAADMEQRYQSEQESGTRRLNESHEI